VYNRVIIGTNVVKGTDNHINILKHIGQMNGLYICNCI